MIMARVELYIRLILTLLYTVIRSVQLNIVFLVQIIKYNIELFFWRMRHFDRAAMFSQVCQELNLLKDEAEENILYINYCLIIFTH